MVCGAARSGTTMLDLMLGNADDAVSVGEISGLFRPYRPHHFNPTCSCGDSDCHVWEGVRDLPEQEFHATLLRRPTCNTVVDSSKDLRWVLDSNAWAARRGIPTYNVVIWKDPIDLCYSYWKRGDGITWYRRVFLVYYERFLGLRLPFIAVNYRSLANDPSGVLRRLCEKLGLDFSEDRARFWERRHHHFFGSIGIARQVQDGESRIRSPQPYSDDFLREFKQEEQYVARNPRMQKVIDALQSQDVMRANPVSITSRAPRYGLKPGWYYRHLLKAMYRRRFPDTRPVVD